MRPGILKKLLAEPSERELPSMRPRPCGPGYATNRSGSFAGPSAFNEAQAMRPGIPHPDSARADLVDILQ